MTDRGAGQDLDAEGYDRLIEFMETPRYQLLQQQFTRETVEHLMVRMGFRMHSPDSYNDLQEQIAYLRQLWAMRPRLEDRVDALEVKFIAAETQQAERYGNIIKAIDTRHHENQTVHAESAKERAAIKADVQSTKTRTMMQLILLLIGILGFFFVRFIVPGG